ncbi:hypothetical protein CCR96_19310 [Halochromatium roseum]|nr:hypothetical protein [Halochromatium roseum]
MSSVAQPAIWRYKPISTPTNDTKVDREVESGMLAGYLYSEPVAADKAAQLIFPRTVGADQSGDAPTSE